MANTDFRHLNALRGTYGNLDACEILLVPKQVQQLNIL